MDYFSCVLSCKCYFVQNLAGYSDDLPEHNWAKTGEA